MRFALAFVDWNAQIINHAATLREQPVRCAEQTLERTARTIERTLLSWSQTERFRVTLRLYHGWHKGYEPTANRRAVGQMVAGMDFSLLPRSNTVVFSSEVQFGDRLIDALPTRLHSRLGIHLPNTLRVQRKEDGPIEKMVDTSIAADLLSWARTSPSEDALILTEDDDLVPAVYVAEAWVSASSSRICLIRHRRSSRPLKFAER